MRSPQQCDTHSFVNLHKSWRIFSLCVCHRHLPLRIHRILCAIAILFLLETCTWHFSPPSQKLGSIESIYDRFLAPSHTRVHTVNCSWSFRLFCWKCWAAITLELLKEDFRRTWIYWKPLGDPLAVSWPFDPFVCSGWADERGWGLLMQTASLEMGRMTGLFIRQPPSATAARPLGANLHIDQIRTGWWSHWWRPFSTEQSIKEGPRN